MKRIKKIKVSQQAWDALESAYLQVISGNPAVAKNWKDQVATSKASDEAGGMAALETDYDWLLLFFAWSHGVKIPRE